jgi:hypothetical protein
MPIRRRRLRSAALFGLASVALILGPPLFAVAQETPKAGTAKAPQMVVVDLTPQEARLHALRAVQAGQMDAARRLSLALLQQDPDDMTALMVMAMAGAKTGYTKLAIIAGKRAYRQAEHKGQKFEAAYLTAAAMDKAKRPLATKLWLRRAAEVAPSDASRDLAKRSFVSVARSSPLTLNLDFGIGPSDNVNGGSLSDVMWIIGLPFAITDALPGGVWHVGVSGDYRLHESATSQTLATFALRQSGVWLSQEAKRRQPTAKASDFAQTAARIGVTHRMRPWDDRPVTLEFGLSAGQSWAAKQAASRDVALRLRAGWSLSDQTLISGEIMANTAQNLRDGRRDATSLSFGTSLVHQTAAMGRVSMGVTLGQIDSAARDLDRRSLGLSVGWRPIWHPAGTVTDLQLGAQVKDFPKMIGLDPEVEVTAGASMTFTKIDYMGFAPKLTLEASRNWSDFIPRDRRDVKLGIGIASTF